MSGTTQDDPLRGTRAGERDEHAYEDAWYRALKAKAELRAKRVAEEKAETPPPAAVHRDE